MESLSTTAGTILAALGLFAKTQRDKGKLEEKVRNLEGKITDDIASRLRDHDITITQHTATLAAHEGSFKVIDTKLDYIKDALDRRRE